jgi:DNA-directed RNA polymerase subunit RPC12/RpoP
MYFVRTFTSGAQDYDPRQKLMIEYKCPACKNVEWVLMTHPNTFKETDIIKCPKCGCLEIDDKKQNLIIKKEILINKKSEIEKEIDRICKEIEKVEVPV